MAVPFQRRVVECDVQLCRCSCAGNLLLEVGAPIYGEIFSESIDGKPQGLLQAELIIGSAGNA